ncbi:MAG: SH3 domain-containing protein [Eubacteriales bacterium]|nr:SH3 domain-containing protein [Eubacteriales bacterium]
MKKNDHSAAYFQPVLLLLLAAAVIVGAIFGLRAFAGGFLKDENGQWADLAVEEETEPIVMTEVQTESEPATEPVTERETEIVATEVQTETETQTESETDPMEEAVYLVLKVGCNFRSGPSMDAEIYGTKEAGITVRFLEDVGGWYKVEIDGVVGYMGSQFF